MSVTKLFDDYDASDSTERTVVSALFHVDGLPFDAPDAAIQDPQFPQLYQPATNFQINWPNALCMFRRVLRRIDESSAYAVAIFVQRKTFSFGPQPHSEWYYSREEVPVPLIKQRTNAAGVVIPNWYEGTIQMMPRPATIRTKQSYRVGDENQADLFAEEIDPNVGLLYGQLTSPMFPRVYQLTGYSMVRFSNNQIVITYRFRTSASIQAIGAIPGISDISLPALGELDGYVPVMSGPMPTVQPFGVRNINGFGQPLP